MIKLKSSEWWLIGIAVVLCVAIVIIMIVTAPINNTIKTEKIKIAHTSATETKLININKAGKKALMNLSGIGETTAENIIKHRKYYGDFKYKDDIMQVDGIGPSKYAGIKDFICVE